VNRFTDKVAFISGAARGQGRAHAVRFAQEGADIIAVDACADHAGVGYPQATEDELAETVRLVEAEGRRIVSGKADVREQEQLDAVVADGVEQLGRLDVVLANAGVFTMADHTWEQSEDEWNATIDIDLSGVWRTCKAAIPKMIEAGNGGSITITASSNGYRAEQNHGAYNAAKLGVVGLMRSLAGELGQFDIRCNTVHPTNVRTTMMYNDMIMPLFKPGQSTATLTPDEYFQDLEFMHLLPFNAMEPEVISDLMLFLASEEARYITATEIPIDGGYIRKVFSYG
jgi:(+)-trans-carveol dehydrogenase